MSSVMQFLVVLGLVALGCTKVTLQGKMSRSHVHGPQDSIWFNALLFAAIAICLAVIFPLAPLDGPALGFAFLDAVCTVAFQTTYALALLVGPLSLTTLTINFSVLLTTGFSVLFFHEKVYLSHLIGIGFLVASMVLSASPKADERGATRRWFTLSITALLTGGLATIFQKMFWTTPCAATPGTDAAFLIVMYAMASVMAFAVYGLWRKAARKPATTIGFRMQPMVYVWLIAIVLAAYQKSYLAAMNAIDGVFLFPTYSGLQPLMLAATGAIFLHDRLNRRQVISLILGVICVAMMNMQFGFSL